MADVREDGEVSELCEVAKVYLKAKAIGLVSIAENRPVVYAYASDATRMLEQATVMAKVSGMRNVVRKAGRGST